MIVVSPSIHITDKEEIIPFADSKYVWVDSIVKKEVIPSGALHLSSLTTCEHPLDSLLAGMKELTQSNFTSAVYVLGMFRLERVA